MKLQTATNCSPAHQRRGSCNDHLIKPNAEVGEMLKLLSKFQLLISKYAFCTPPQVLRQAEAFEKHLRTKQNASAIAKELLSSYALMDLKIKFVDDLLRLQVKVLNLTAATTLINSSADDFYLFYFSFFDLTKHRLHRADDHRLLFIQVAHDIFLSNCSKPPTLIAVDQDMNPSDLKKKPHNIQRIKDGQCLCSNLLRASEQPAVMNSFRVAIKAPLAIAKSSSLFPSGLSKHMTFSVAPNEQMSAPGYLNIAVIGRSGIGKTTFIKSMCNYLSFESLTEAAAFHANVIDSEGNYDLMRRMNTLDVITYSETTMSQSYTVRSARGRVRFVDTPGHGGDTFDAVQRYLWTNLDELQGVCLLLDPNEFPLNEMTCSFLEKIMRFIPPQNVVFCFTRARSSSFEVGLSLFGLEKLVKVNEWDIGLNAQTMYCIDNEPMQYLAQHRSREARFGFEEIDRIAESWDRSHSATRSLLQYLMQLRPFTLSPGDMRVHLRREVLRLSEPIARLGQCLSVSLRLLEGMRGREEASAFELRARLVPRVFCSNSSTVEIFYFADDDDLRVMVISPDQFPRAGVSRRMSTVIPDEICLQCGGVTDSHKHLTVEYTQTQVPVEQLLEGVEPSQLERVWEEQVIADLNKLLDLAVALTFSLRTSESQTRGYHPVDEYLRLWLGRCAGPKFYHVRESIMMVRELYKRKLKSVVEPPDPFALIQTLHRWPRYSQVFHQVSAADPSGLPVWLI